MPDISERMAEARETAADGELPYISKSRVTEWVKNPEHFRLKYIEGLRGEETDAMRRGTRLHETFEDFYYALYEYVESEDQLPEFWELKELLFDYKRWADFVDPYVANFLCFEYRRLSTAQTINEYLPYGVEEEMWMERDGDPPWMGFADVILPAASLDEIEADDGAVVVDFKTGSVPDERYRDEGIYLELEYYTMIFGSRYDVVGAAAYYPREDELVVSHRDESLRERVFEAVEEMLHYVDNYDEYDHFPTNPGPLCKWGEDSSDQSEYYGICPCTWGVPANNREEFEEMVESGMNNYQIAEKLGTTPDAVRYWQYKFDL